MGIPYASRPTRPSKTAFAGARVARHAKYGLLALAYGLATACSSDPFGCTDTFGFGACPAQVAVKSATYAVGPAIDLVNVEHRLTEYEQMSGRSAAYFANTTTIALDGVDPLVFLVGRNGSDDPDEPGEFRELWSLADDPFPVALCDYFTEERKTVYAECAP